jgi:hypothetical protein
VTESHKQWLSWGILSLVTLAVALFFGVQYPMPKQPDQPPDVVQLGANFTNPVDIEGSSSASAPALTFESDTDTGLFRSAANVLNISTGGTERLEIDSSALTIVPTLDVDGPLDIDTTGSIDLTTTEAAADAIHLDANGAVTTGIDIDLGSVSGMTIDGGLVDVGGATCGVADGDNDVCIAAVLEVDGETELDGALDADSTSDFADTATFSKGSGTALDVSSGGELNLDGTMDVNGVITNQDDLEHILFPTVASTAFTYTASAGGTVTLWTIGDGEIWMVHDVYCNVTTNFDCTGDDCTLHIGDGNDEDGLCDLDDGELQTTDVEVTGGAAGWQCFGSTDTIGAYITSGRGWIYAPSGAAETIDAVLAATGDDFSAGAATCYLVYTRIQ